MAVHWTQEGKYGADWDAHATIDATFLYRIRVRIQTRTLFDAPYALEYGLEERFRQRLSEIETMFGQNQPTG